MPLKHGTETLLVFFLGLLTVLAGIVVAILPPITVSIIPWLVAFVLSIAYPLSLYPLLRDRRAEYEFRALHFLPAFILLLWLVLQILQTMLPGLRLLLMFLTWGWSLPIVLIAFLLLFLFCLQVIRQRGMRATILASLMIPFLALGIVGEQFDWDRTLSSVVWRTDDGNGPIAQASSASSMPLSGDRDEEEWRRQLREMEERRQERLREREGRVVHGARDAVAMRMMGSTSSMASSIGPDRTPPILPTSGMETEHLLLIGVAAYCAVLHRRASARA